MSKKHQFKASGKKTRTGQHRKSRHKENNFLNQFTGLSRRQLKEKRLIG